MWSPWTQNPNEATGVCANFDYRQFENPSRYRDVETGAKKTGLAFGILGDQKSILELFSTKKSCFL